jgi:hypothetical protein
MVSKGTKDASVSPAFRKQLEGYGLTTANTATRSSVAAPGICLAGLRSLPELPGAQQIPQFLAGKA